MRGKNEKDSRTRIERRYGSMGRTMKIICFVCDTEWRKFKNVFVTYVWMHGCMIFMMLACEYRHTCATAECMAVKGQFSRIYPPIWLWVLGIKCRFFTVVMEVCLPNEQCGSLRDSLKVMQMCPQRMVVLEKCLVQRWFEGSLMLSSN